MEVFVMINGMTSDEIRQQIIAWDKNAGDIDIVTSGATSIVGLTDSAAYRFPTTKDALAIQLYEVALYEKLDDTVNVPIPRVMHTYQEPPCTVITRLPGQHLDTATLASLPTGKLQTVIRQLVQFSIALNEAIDTKTIAELEHSLIGGKAHERSWADYLSHHLKNAQFPKQPWLEDLAHEQYSKWSTIKHSSKLPKIAVHDELHTGNLLFVDGQISGIIDFGDTTVGTIAQELRQLYRISEQAVRIALEEYAAITDIAIDFEEVATWAITQELASYCRWMSIGDVNRPSFIRSQTNLRKWLPGFKG